MLALEGKSLVFPRRRGFMAGTGGEAIGLGRGEGAPLGSSTRGTEEVEERKVGSEIMPRVIDFFRSRIVVRLDGGRFGVLRPSGLTWLGMTGDGIAEVEAEAGLAKAADGGAPGAPKGDIGEGGKGGRGEGRGGALPGGRFICGGRGPWDGGMRLSK
jgi:hypothetical protein